MHLVRIYIIAQNFLKYYQLIIHFPSTMQHADIALCKIKNNLQSAVGLIVLIMAYHGSEDRSFLKPDSLLHQTPPPHVFDLFFHRQKLRKWEQKKLCKWETRKRKDPVSPPLSVHLCFSLSLILFLSQRFCHYDVEVCV